MRDFVVLDADSQEQVQKLEEMYPACSTCPCAHTRKGRHYYFLRTPLCDELGMTDAPGIQPQLDFSGAVPVTSELEINTAKKTRLYWGETPEVTIYASLHGHGCLEQW